MQASVVVSTYNRRDVVLRTARTLLQQEFPASEYEIIVVVDGATDGTAEALPELGERVRVVEQANRGLAGARNTGARSACGELLIFLDEDMEGGPELVRVPPKLTVPERRGGRTRGKPCPAGAHGPTEGGGHRGAPGGPPRRPSGQA